MNDMALKLVANETAEFGGEVFAPSVPDVLVIEADELLQTVIVDAAEKVGLSAQAVSTYADAKLLMMGGNPSVVVTDLDLPGVDAVASFRELAALGVTSKFIILSDMDDAIVEAAASAARAQGIDMHKTMRKPAPIIRLQTEMLACQDLGLADAQNDMARNMLIDGFLAVYQPKIQLSLESDLEANLDVQGRQYGLIGLETLARLPDADGNLSAPLAYLGPRSEQFRTGLFTMQMVNRASSELLPLLAKYPDLKMSFNVVPGDIRELLSSSMIDDYLRSMHVDPSRVIFEVTADSDNLKNDSYTDLLRGLTDKGYLLSFDNVADGFSSYLNLHDIPFYEIKLDRVLVAELTQSKRARNVARAVIEIGHEFGSKVTAVGVESAETAMVANELGFDFAQGNYFMRPESALNLAFE